MWFAEWPKEANAMETGSGELVSRGVWGVQKEESGSGRGVRRRVVGEDVVTVVGARGNAGRRKKDMALMNRMELRCKGGPSGGHCMRPWSTLSF